MANYGLNIRTCLFKNLQNITIPSIIIVNIIPGTEMKSRVFMENHYRIIKEKLYKFESNKGNYYTYMYNSNGLLSRKSYFDKNDTLISYHMYFYNSDHQLTHLKRFDNENNLIDYELYTYYYNKVRKIERFDNKSRLLNYSFFNYDTDGKKVKQTDYSSDNDIIHYINFIYDQDNVLIKEEQIPVGNTHKTEEITREYGYNESGVSLITITDDDVRKSFKEGHGYMKEISFGYNEDGNLDHRAHYYFHSNDCFFEGDYISYEYEKIKPVSGNDEPV